MTQLQFDLTLGLPSDAFPLCILPLPINEHNFFPYPCVITESTQQIQQDPLLNPCFMCHKRFSLKQMKHHVGWHLARNDRAIGEENVVGEPCGFCGRIKSPCSTNGKNPLSDCIYYWEFQNRKKPSQKNPCTNRPEPCPVDGDQCSKPFVWKYNMATHLRVSHKRTLSDAEEQQYSVSKNEKELLDEMFREKRSTKQKKKRNITRQPTKKAKNTDKNQSNEEGKYDDEDDSDD